MKYAWYVYNAPSLRLNVPNIITQCVSTIVGFIMSCSKIVF